MRVLLDITIYSAHSAHVRGTRYLQTVWEVPLNPNKSPNPYRKVNNKGNNEPPTRLRLSWRRWRCSSVIQIRNRLVITIGFSQLGFSLHVQQFEDMSRCSSVSTMTRLRAGRPGFDSRQGLGLPLVATVSRPPSGPPSLQTNGYRRLFPRG
jgi:hypothetical protein